jgi:hypothetical protein
VVVWQSWEQDGDGFGIFGQRFDAAATPVGSEFLVNSTTSEWQENAAIASDGAGGLVVVWQSPPGEIRGQRFCALPLEQGNVLRAAKSGADVALSFPRAPAAGWRVYRDPAASAIGTTALDPDASDASYLDPDTVSPGSGSSLFYYLRGLNPCSPDPGP